MVVACIVSDSRNFRSFELDIGSNSYILSSQYVMKKKILYHIFWLIKDGEQVWKLEISNSIILVKVSVFIQYLRFEISKVGEDFGNIIIYIVICVG